MQRLLPDTTSQSLAISWTGSKVNPFAFQAGTRRGNWSTRRRVPRPPSCTAPGSRGATGSSVWRSNSTPESFVVQKCSENQRTQSLGNQVWFHFLNTRISTIVSSGVHSIRSLPVVTAPKLYWNYFYNIFLLHPWEMIHYLFHAISSTYHA